MFRLLFMGLALYLASRIVGGLFKSKPSSNDVRGETKSKALDLSDDDVIDIDFKESKDD